MCICLRNFDSVSKDHILGMYVYAGPDQPCARPEATVAARPLKKTDKVLTSPTWPISSHLRVGRSSDVGGQGSM